jgi:hypothetical protein
MSIVNKKTKQNKAERGSRKASVKSDHVLQEKLNKANRLLSKVINREVFK